MEFISEWLNNIVSIVKTFGFRDLVDIIAISFIIYNILKLIHETRAEQLLKGLIILLAVYMFSSVFGLTMLTYLLRMLFEFAVILLVVIFQPELRKALEWIGSSKVSNKPFKFITQSGKTSEVADAEKKTISDVVDTAVLFSRSKTGALIVFERQTKLSDIASTGTVLDCRTSVAILGNVFFNKAPLHDGAVIIRDGLIHSAGCILPLTKNQNIDPNLGTRHRAALGMSEESDAVVLVVSEETGAISLALNGRLLRDFDRNMLLQKLTELIIGQTEEKSEFLSWFSKKKRGNKQE